MYWLTINLFKKKKENFLLNDVLKTSMTLFIINYGNFLRPTGGTNKYCNKFIIMNKK